MREGIDAAELLGGVGERVRERVHGTSQALSAYALAWGGGIGGK